MLFCRDLWGDRNGAHQQIGSSSTMNSSATTQTSAGLVTPLPAFQFLKIPVEGWKEKGNNTGMYKTTSDPCQLVSCSHTKSQGQPGTAQTKGTPDVHLSTGTAPPSCGSPCRAAHFQPLDPISSHPLRDTKMSSSCSHMQSSNLAPARQSRNNSVSCRSKKTGAAAS